MSGCESFDCIVFHVYALLLFLSGYFGGFFVDVVITCTPGCSMKHGQQTSDLIICLQFFVPSTMYLSIFSICSLRDVMVSVDIYSILEFDAAALVHFDLTSNALSFF
jgi:hypothetical protein